MQTAIRRVLVGAGAFAVLAVVAVPSALAQDSDLVVAMRQVDGTCAQSPYGTETALMGCYDTNERVVWTRYAPEALPYYEKMTAERNRVAAEIDEGRITLAEGQHQLQPVMDEFSANIRMLAAQEDAQRARQAADQARGQAFLEELLGAAASFSNAWLAAKAAAPSPPRPTSCTTQFIGNTAYTYCF